MHTRQYLKMMSTKILIILGFTGCPRMIYTQKSKILRIFITIKTIEFGILIYLNNRARTVGFLENF